MSFGKKYSSFASFEEFFRLYYRKVREFVYSVLKDSSNADEVTQQCFIKLWNKRAHLSDVSNLDGFVFMVVKNTTLDYLRSLGRWQKVTRLPQTDQIPLDTREESRVDAGIIREIVSEVIAQMPEQRRKVYQMSREEGLNSDAISEALGISKRTAEKHLQLALSQLRSKLGDYIS